MRSNQLEQFWLKTIKQKNITDEELMKRLNISNPGILQIYLRTDNPKYIRLLCQALEIKPTKVKQYILHHLHKDPQNKDEFFEDLAYRNLYNYNEIKTMLNKNVSANLKQRKIGIKEAKILFNEFGVDIFQSTKFETYPATRNPQTLEDKVCNYIFLNDLNIHQFLREFGIPNNRQSIREIQKWIMTRNDKTKTEILQKLEDKVCNYIFLNDLNIHQFLREFGIPNNRQSIREIQKWIMTRNDKTKTEILQKLDVVDKIEELMRKPMLNAANQSERTKITVEDQLPSGKKEKLANLFREINRQTIKEQKTKPMIDQHKEERKESKNMSTTTAYAEIAQILIQKLNNGLLTLNVIKEDFPIVYEAYRKEFEKADMRFNDLSKIINDNKPLVYDGVELSTYEKQMLKTMLAGIVINKKIPLPAS